MTAPALVIGAGPAGLMAADHLAQAGLQVVIADQMPSPARKFLMAGKSGLNLTKSQDLEAFVAAYTGPETLRAAVRDFGPDRVCEWANGLGQPVFTGSTGRVFPEAMKASPLLRAWLRRLEGMGVQLRRKWRWAGMDGGAVLFDTPEGAHSITPRVCVLACGGGSWARLGSDGAWADHLPGAVRPFQPSNAGVVVPWSAHMRPHFGTPIKSIRLVAGDIASRGEIVLSAQGIEGGGIYGLSAPLRAGAALTMDLVPDLDMDALRTRLARPRGKASLSNHLRKTLGLTPGKIALLQEFARPLPPDLAPVIKSLPIRHGGLAPIDQAISTAGGIAWDAMDGWMLRDHPGVFCAGEMVDWDAPTGGYLLTGCLASGRAAGRAAAEWAANTA